jgi:hypothetical protein
MEYSLTTMKGAAKCNKFAVLQFLHAQGCPWDETVSAAAAESGDIEVLRWVHEHGCKWDDRYNLREAARSGSDEMTAWVKQQRGVVCCERAISAAAGKGHTAVCEFLRAEQCPWSTLACEAAADHGHAETLCYLIAAGCPWDAYKVCRVAAIAGSVAFLEYLQQHEAASTPAMLTLMLNFAGANDELAAAQW